MSLQDGVSTGPPVELSRDHLVVSEQTYPYRWPHLRVEDRYDHLPLSTGRRTAVGGVRACSAQLIPARYEPAARGRPDPAAALWPATEVV